MSAIDLIKENNEAISAVAALFIALFTFTLWRSTGRLWKITKASLEEARQVQRAYVTMSHKSPGLELVTHIGRAILAVEIRNSGRTPATVTDVSLQLDWFGSADSAPDKPIYRVDTQRNSVGAFLVAQDSFDLEVDLKMPEEGEGDELWLYGFVDYIDEFGHHYRSGYARIYVADRPQNNLVFVRKRGWNYDRLRKKGEGIDWV